jgi:integrase
MARPGKPWVKRGRFHAKIRGRLVNLNIPGEVGQEPTAAVWDAYRAAVVAAAEEAARSVVRAEIVQPASTGAVCRPGAVAALGKQFLAAADLAPGTRRDYGSRLRWLARAAGGVAVADLDPEDIERAARRESWTSNTRRQTLVVCQTFLRWCGRKDLRLRLPSVRSRGDEAVIPPGEFRRLLAWASGGFHALLRFLWATGARPSEACSLTADMIDWGGGVAVLRDHKLARKGKRRTLYLTGESLAVLREQARLHPAGKLFRGVRGAPITAARAKVMFARCARRAGVRGKCLYFTRHTFAHRALRSGLSSAVVAQLLGHVDTRMVDVVYGHLGADARWLRDQAARLDGAA